MFKAQIDGLKGENAELRRENARLQGKIAGQKIAAEFRAELEKTLRWVMVALAVLMVGLTAGTVALVEFGGPELAIGISVSISVAVIAFVAFDDFW